ncbi:hypothetical protein SAMN05444166_5815 [Singulisphaera sp. GP187]|uniref:hypothetical protein n=1 Tax=Singulisphaera sp. GP187 TaxID=1882752 RepID=UPI000928AB4E|nr:hypothetical protein [Singulisphaera sp. GP187]SIO58801.1 hypothetical protein SAMN05444166_5815 [Singulisphaera sp. GP187]
MIDHDVLTCYGAAAGRLGSSLAAARSISWFASPGQLPPRGMAESLVQVHLRALGTAASKVEELQWLGGSLELLHRDRWGIDPYEPWGPRWAESEKALGGVVADLQARVVGLTAARARLIPPLWPLAGNPNVVGECVIPDLAALPPSRTTGWGDRDRVVAWGLLCAAQSWISEALLGELVADLIPGPNPFLPLLNLYCLGYFPMGWEGSQYSVYCYEPGERSPDLGYGHTNLSEPPRPPH